MSLNLTGFLRIQEHKRNYKSGELKSKPVCHAFDTDHTPDFEDIDVLASAVTNLHQWLFLEDWYTGKQSQPYNEAKPVPTEIEVLM